MNATDLGQFDRTLRNLTAADPAGRPFLCHGWPFGCDAFLVGINPGTDIPFWPFWSQQAGCDKDGWLKAYLQRHPRFKPTRERIERLSVALAPFRILETNIYSSHSRREADLPRDSRRTEVFDFLLYTIHPKLAFVHGKSAVSHLSALVGRDLRLGEFTPVKYRGVDFEVIAGHHLSYRWSYAKVEELAKLLHTRLSRES